MMKLTPRPVSVIERWAAALAYIGMGSLAAMIWGQGSFMRQHARLAFSLHLIRLLISGLGLGGWYFLWGGRDGRSVDEMISWVWHVIGLFVLGVPLTPFGGSHLLVWLIPLIIIWLLDLVGFVLALQGIPVPWDRQEEAMAGRPAATIQAEKERLRRLRDQRLERIRYATTTGASERLRERRVIESKRELGANLVRLDHLNHLLALGELSAARYTELAAEVQEEIDALREELAALGARVSRGVSVRPVSTERMAALGSHIQASTLSLSFVDRSGVPLFTYGHFPLDEALIAGMLSAFDSLSREVFGSPINKTQLAEGQVLYFFHGQYCVLMALFDSEPSPSQLSRLQAYLTTFEERNADELQRDPVVAARLTPIGVDLTLPASS